MTIRFNNLIMTIWKQTVQTHIYIYDLKYVALFIMIILFNFVY